MSILALSMDFLICNKNFIKIQGDKIMINVKKIASSVIVFTLILSTIFSLFVPVSAATYGSGTRTGTITVTTKANYWVPGSESITLSQTKGTCRLEKYNFFTGKTKSG